MTSLHPVISKSLALVILLALLGGVYSFAIEPVINRYTQLDDAIVTQSDLLHRYRALGLSRESLQQKLIALNGKDTANSGSLPGKSESLVGAELQNWLKKIVEQHNGNLGSVQILLGKKEGDFRKITVRARITGTTEGVRNVLYMLERAMSLSLLQFVRQASLVDDAMLPS